jgi:hypothetical protein
MKILRIKLIRLRNEEWFNFFTEFKTFVTQSTPQALNIEALMLIQGEAPFAVFVKTLNANIERYQSVLSRRHGRHPSPNGEETKGGDISNL